MKRQLFAAALGVAGLALTASPASASEVWPKAPITASNPAGCSVRVGEVINTGGGTEMVNVTGRFGCALPVEETGLYGKSGTLTVAVKQKDNLDGSFARIGDPHVSTVWAGDTNGNGRAFASCDTDRPHSYRGAGVLKYAFDGQTYTVNAVGPVAAVVCPVIKKA